MIVYEQRILDTILNSVIVAYEVSKEDVLRHTRKREFVEPRQIILAMGYSFTCNGLQNIGKYYGGKNHATILYSMKQVIDFYETRKGYAKTVDMIINRINFELTTSFSFQDIIAAKNGDKKDNVSKENLLSAFNSMVQELMLTENTSTILETVQKLKDIDRKIWSNGVTKNAEYNPYVKESETNQ